MNHTRHAVRGGHEVIKVTGPACRVLAHTKAADGRPIQNAFDATAQPGRRLGLLNPQRVAAGEQGGSTILDVLARLGQRHSLQRTMAISHCLPAGVAGDPALRASLRNLEVKAGSVAVIACHLHLAHGQRCQLLNCPPQFLPHVYHIDPVD